MRVIALSLTHLGLGLMIVQALVGVREVGRGFFTLCGWCGVGLACLGLIASTSAGGLAAGSGTRSVSSGDGIATIGLVAVCLVAFAVGWAFLRARRRDIAAPLIHGSGIVAALAVLAQGWSLAKSAAPAAGAGIASLSAADFLLSSALLGGVTVAMVLGHWYLVQPGLSIEPLARLSWSFIGLLAIRAVMEAGSAAAAVSRGGISLSPPPGEVLAFPALILAQRALFGLVGPIVLAPLVHRTVTMRSTMSATGLLYVAVALVWVGEFLSKYLLLPLRLV